MLEEISIVGEIEEAINPFSNSLEHVTIVRQGQPLSRIFTLYVRLFLLLNTISLMVKVEEISGINGF